MSTDLSRALDELAGHATEHADLGPVQRVVTRRRRRRVARRTAAGASTLAVVGALALAAPTLSGQHGVLGPSAAGTATATTDPSPTGASTGPSAGAALPGCGSPVPAAASGPSGTLAITAADRGPADTITATLLLAGATAADLESAEVRLYVPYAGGYMLALATLPPGGWTDTPDGATRVATGSPEPCEGIEPFSTMLVAAVAAPAATVVSETVEAPLG